MFRSVLSFVFLIFIPTFSLYAQLISSETYETEEDLHNGLESGFLTFDQYLELLDMIQTKVLLTSAETDKLEFIPDLSSMDVWQIKAVKEDIDLYQKTSSFLSPETMRAKRENKTHPLFSGKLVFKLYEKFKEERAENYLWGDFTTGNHIIWHIETDQIVDSSKAMLTQGDFRIRKRYAKFLLPQYSTNITLGNFDQKIGLGLNIGYHPYFAYSDESNLKFEDTFLYPVFGRYNGIIAESKLKSFSLTVFYSKNQREKIKDQISALDLSLWSEKIQAGLCFSRGELGNIENKNTFHDDCQSFHFNTKLKSMNSSGEYALLSNSKSGFAFNLFSSCQRYSFAISFWRYEDEFIHPRGEDSPIPIMKPFIWKRSIIHIDPNKQERAEYYLNPNIVFLTSSI